MTRYPSRLQLEEVLFLVQFNWLGCAVLLAAWPLVRVASDRSLLQYQPQAPQPGPGSHSCMSEAREHFLCLHLIGIVSLCLLLGSLLSGCQWSQQRANDGSCVKS